MNKIKIVFSDLDGTLLDRQGKVSKRTVQSVRRISEEGISFILISARAPEEMSDVANRLSLKTPMISYNGGMIYKYNSSDTLEILEDVPLDTEEMRFIYACILKKFPMVSTTFYSQNTWYAEYRDKWVQMEIDLTGVQPEIANLNLILDSQTPVHKMMMMGDEESLDQLEDELRTHNYSNTSVYRSSAYYLEATNLMANKLTALKKVSGYFHISKENIMAIGDNYNDLAMIDYAGIGVAIKNAPQQVLDVADFVTVSNEDDGVSTALSHYFG